ncbi:MAG: ABC transporter permease [bacterium]
MQNLWTHRRTISLFALREIKGRYAGTMVGFIWNVINPLSLILLYTFIFSHIMNTKLAGVKYGPFGYGLYICSGILPWLAFQESIFRSTSTFLENAGFIKKVFIPEEIYVATVVFSSAVNLALAYTLFVIILGFLGHFTSILLLIIPFAFLLQQVFCFGLGIGLATVTIFFKDVGLIVGLILQLWFWATPIVYAEAIIPESYKWVIQLNPMYYFMKIYHSVVILQEYPGWRTFAISFIFAIVSVLIGTQIFQRLKNDLRDEV